MRLTVVEVADFGAALDRFVSGERENYRAQYYSTTYLKNLAAICENVTIIGAMTDEKANRTVDGVEVRTLNYWTPEGPGKLAQAIQAAAPTHLLMRIPLPKVIRQAATQGLRIAAVLADSYNVSGWSLEALKQRYRQFDLARALNLPAVEMVSNHNLASCRSLVDMGVQKKKIIPWEWPTDTSPADFSVKTRDAREPISLIYVGMLTYTKGVLDVVEAIASHPTLKERAKVTFYGKGDSDAITSRANDLGVSANVILGGLVPNDEVQQRMRDADIVLVPSHHAYPEGLPNTVREALTVRTPLVMSDHPMFGGYFSSDYGTLMVPEKSPAAMAEAILKIVESPDEYARHSHGTELAYAAIDCPNMWADVIDAWLKNDPDGYLKERMGRFS